MTLDESAFSDIDDAAVKDEMLEVIYKGSDNRPAWIGAHRPRTSITDLIPHARWATIHYSFYLQFVERYMEKRGRVMDVGCGAGQNTAMLARYADRAVGIDSDPKAIAFATKYNSKGGVLFCHGIFPDTIFVDGPCDYIFFVETMEHIDYKEQERVIRHALDMLNPDGLMFITTPREDSPSPPHIGVWSPDWTAKMLDTFKENVVRHWYISSHADPLEVKMGLSTHHALVMKP